MPASTQSLKPREDGGWDVETEHGTIHAKVVVNAAGTVYLVIRRLGTTLVYCVFKLVMFICCCIYTIHPFGW